ncbi:CHASE2 domain-containing protein [Algibacillus agarilyticus]|uniref:CHASE2 domain-containing protein n=1 Tax=Algibacillus agarilyticus TaxID=2234133 RepID=UPI000DD04C8D|nr:adenylate/guanylate cyclase domain-containing protein [Algibacillus agarilyticus]
MFSRFRPSFIQLAKIASTTVLFVLVLLQLSQFGDVATHQLKRLDGMFYDLRLKTTLEHRPVYNDTNISIIDIDEKSLAEHGRWPWSRRKVAELIDKLLDAGVIVIAFDVVFSEPERNPIDELTQELGTDNHNIQALTQYKEDIDGDLRMSQSLENGDVVLGIVFEKDSVTSRGIVPDNVIRIDQDVPIPRIKALPFGSYIGNIDVLHEAAIGKGFFNAVPDDDGSIRRAALLIQYEGTIYPSLALEAARLYSLADEIKVDVITDGNDQFNVLGVLLNDQLVKTDENGRVLVPYRGGRNSFPYISAADVLAGTIEPDSLMDSIVFVGTSSVGLADLRETPVGIQYPGVEVHANILEGLLHPDVFSYRHDLADYYTVLYLVLFGVVMAFYFPKMGPGQMAFWGMLLLATTIGFNTYLWANEKISMPLTTPILLCLFLTVINIAFGFFAENSQKKVIKGMFDQYVPPAHIDKMLNDPNSVSLAGDRKNMSVLFSDIRSFTTISEGLSANDLKLLLNRYFSPITKTILDYQGTIDKYVGDMVMAFWGAPLDDEKHATNSIKAAFSMLEITAQLREQFVLDGLPAIKVGIGINTGDMNVGDMGSEFRRAYTVLGDSVNLGSRLESLTKAYGIELLVSEYTMAQAIDDFEFRPIDRVIVKGKTTAVATFEPICEKGALNEQDRAELDQYNAAYTLYLSQLWPEAEQAFNDLHALNPERMVYSIYLDRINQLKNEPKQDDWDGSFTHTSK